jgi:hypothetical protein
VEGGNPEVYIFDCDELANLFQRDDLDGLWDRFVDMVNNGQVRTVDQVFCELKKFPRALDKYKHLKSQMCLSTADQYDESVTDYMDTIEEATPRLIDFMGRTSICDPADPWLVAIAAARDWTVVTHEKRRGNKVNRSVYTACKKLDVACLNLEEFLKVAGGF